MIKYIIGTITSLIICVPVSFFYIRRAVIKAQSLEKRAADSERMAYIGMLASGLAHEIKNPLSTVNINLQLLKEDLQDAGEEISKNMSASILRRVDILQKELLRLEEILNDFLRFAGGKELELKDCDINEVLDEVVDFISPEAGQKNILILKEYDAHLPRCRIDSNLMKQAILNIIINAEQAMENGGELTVSTSANKNTIQIDITDTGTGIQKNIMDKIFQVYFSTKKDGTGLGLPTSKRIIEEHKGTLSVYSKEGRGSNFTIKLPVN